MEQVSYQLRCVLTLLATQEAAKNAEFAMCDLLKILDK